MKITDFSIRRPMTILVVVTVILLLGAVSLSRLNIDLYPEMNLPVGAVMTEYSGASPQEVEEQVTRPLESVLGTVNDLDSIQSMSNRGQSVVIAEFNWGTDMEFAALDMREKVDMVKDALPGEAGEPLVFKMDPNMLPIMQISIAGDHPYEVKQVTEDVIKPRMERVSGVASVRIQGGMEREIKVLIDKAKLQGYGLGLTQVVQTLGAENRNTSAGDVQSGRKDMMVRVTGKFDSLDEIRNVVLTSQDGNTVYLKDIAKVEDGTAEMVKMSRINGQPGLAVLVNKQSDSNTVQVAQKLKSELNALESEIPSDFNFQVVMDQSKFIEQSINSVIKKIFLGGLLAVLIMLVFLRNIRSTLIISTSIPVSIIATFALLYFNDMTLNLVSMGGLALGIGLIVDDAIVVLENIYRHRQEGYGLMDASRKATDEVGNPVIAATLTTIAVFMPIVFVEGLAAQLFRPMALTVTFAVAASLFIALTVVPLLASRYLKLENPVESSLVGKIYYASEKRFNALFNWYYRVLKWSLGHRIIVVVCIAALFVGSLALVPLIGAEFMPTMDEGYVKAELDMPNGTTLGETNRVTSKVEQLSEEIPEVKNIITNVGFVGSESMGGETSSDKGQVYFQLNEKDSRSRSSEEIAEIIRDKSAGIPGADIDVSATGPANEGQNMGSPISVTIEGDELDKLEDLGSRAADIVSDVPGTAEVSSSLGEGRPEMQVVAMRDRAAEYGISGAQIASAVRTAMKGQVATRYRTGGDEIDVRVRLASGIDAKMKDLESLTLHSPVAGSVSLREIAGLEKVKGPTTINRQDQTRVVTITGNLVGRDLGSVMQDIKANMKDIELPQGYIVDYGGQNEQMMESFGSLGLALLLAVALVYLVMVAQFESLLYPFIIMFSVPVTVTGVILSLMISGRPFSVPAFIGVILLAGIVVKNAIVLVDYINVLRHRGMERDEAILKAGPVRMRPILMTALTAILAMFPMALGIGEGSEGQAPLGTVVVGGLAFSTIITLVLVPVVYVIMDDLTGWFNNRILKRNRNSFVE
ncbi:MAG: efflux RND transporter permease subunit [Clostridiales bacterium]|nr:efflux RND transporter permease subunit [Clostridiales bacterium]MCF8023362.1 efflux RND transporter permease subunit [Clostridiales bacterium]